MSEPSDPVSPTTSHHSAPVSFPSRAPQVHHLPVLKADLKKVAASRGNVYARKVAILVHWENDTTGAEKDIIIMCKVMETIGIQYTDHILKAKDVTPSWNLSAKIRKIILDCYHSKLYSLFVFYYVGHGSIVDGKLHFIQGGKRASWSDICADFFNEQDAVRHVDVLGVIDCCYSGAATREPALKVTQVIAACGPNERTNPRGQQVSFTMRLFRAVQYFKGQSSVSTAALFQEIQRQKPRNAPLAVFETLSGTQPIRLVFNDRPFSSGIPRPLLHVNEKHVLVKLTLHGHSQIPHSEVLESFKNVIQDLPPNMKVEISDAYETDQSIFLIIGMSWEAWALWTMVAHLDFCCPICDKTQPAGIQCPTIVALDVANTAGIQALSSQPSSAREKGLKRVRKKVHRGHERPTGQSTKNDDDKNTGTNPTANKESVVDEDPSTSPTPGYGDDTASETGGSPR